MKTQTESPTSSGAAPLLACFDFGEHKDWKRKHQIPLTARLTDSRPENDVMSKTNSKPKKRVRRSQGRAAVRVKPLVSRRERHWWFRVQLIKGA